MITHSLARCAYRRTHFFVILLIISSALRLASARLRCTSALTAPCGGNLGGASADPTQREGAAVERTRAQGQQAFTLQPTASPRGVVK